MGGTRRPWSTPLVQVRVLVPFSLPKLFLSIFHFLSFLLSLPSFYSFYFPNLCLCLGLILNAIFFRSRAHYRAVSFPPLRFFSFPLLSIGLRSYISISLFLSILVFLLWSAPEFVRFVTEVLPFLHLSFPSFLPPFFFFVCFTVEEQELR